MKLKPGQCVPVNDVYKVKFIPEMSTHCLNSSVINLSTICENLVYKETGPWNIYCQHPSCNENRDSQKKYVRGAILPKSRDYPKAPPLNLPEIKNSKQMLRETKEKLGK